MLWGMRKIVSLRYGVSALALGGLLVLGRGGASGADARPDMLENSIGMKLKLIKPGSYTMGADEGGTGVFPRHEVKVNKAFYIGVFEVTQAQWAEIMGSNPSYFKGTNLPVECVSWSDAQTFLQRLSQKEKKTYRLPSEVEWEYACRAGSTGEYDFGDGAKYLGDHGWFAENGEKRTHPVGLKQPNAWGLYDMHGNVYEWCGDSWGEMPVTEESSEKEVRGGSDHAYRGGSWFAFADNCRAATRRSYGMSGISSDLGLRVVLEADGP